MTCWWCGADTRYLARLAPKTTHDEPSRPTLVPDAPGNGSRPAMLTPTAAPTPAPTQTQVHLPPPALSELATVAPVAGVRRRAESRGAAASVTRAAAPRRKVGEERATAAARPLPGTMLATAVYLSGSSGLEVGGRYGFMIEDDRLRLVGPHDPSVTAFERPIAGIVASISQGNLLLTIPDRKLGTFLAFRAVAGISLEALVRSIAEAADASVRP